MAENLFIWERKLECIAFSNPDPSGRGGNRGAGSHGAGPGGRADRTRGSVPRTGAHYGGESGSSQLRGLRDVSAKQPEKRCVLFNLNFKLKK